MEAHIFSSGHFSRLQGTPTVPVCEDRPVWAFLPELGGHGSHAPRGVSGDGVVVIALSIQDSRMGDVCIYVLSSFGVQIQRFKHKHIAYGRQHAAPA